MSRVLPRVKNTIGRMIAEIIEITVFSSIAAAIVEKLKTLPGVQLVMAQPISDRVDEMVTGVRSDVAVKVFGDDLEDLRRVGDQISRVLSDIAGTRDLRVERVTGQQYLTIDVDRQAADLVAQLKEGRIEGIDLGQFLLVYLDGIKETGIPVGGILDAV